ncbi:MAG: hypothetical protein F2907_08370 [Actinobacteria bacterium]|uniref:Unannotated protein n=2 Tax=freshwater metagenome TaxID=449393 RepID=A0A6J7RWL3_9ZZZZ|nr:hypothetical protein [Actinomycetota bacterium]
MIKRLVSVGLAVLLLTSVTAAHAGVSRGDEDEATVEEVMGLIEESTANYDESERIVLAVCQLPWNDCYGELVLLDKLIVHFQSDVNKADNRFNGKGKPNKSYIGSTPKSLKKLVDRAVAKSKKADKKIDKLSKLLAEEKPVSTAEEIPELERSNKEMVEAIEEFDAAIYALLWFIPAPDALGEHM